MEDEIAYSSNEAFNELIDKDQSTELVGYVDEIHGVQVVGSKTKYKLLKFVLSNCQKRILCLIWGEELIKKYQNNITIHRILHIDGGFTKSMVMTYYKENQNLVPFELIIQKNTIIEYLGYHETTTENVTTPSIVDFENIGKTQGLISISGYIKTVFAQTVDRNNHMSYGCGSITDGTYKVTVRICDFTPLDLPKGTAVTVIGEIKNNSGPLTIVCTNNSSTEVNKEKSSLSTAALLKAIRTPKRGLLKETDNIMK